MLAFVEDIDSCVSRLDGKSLITVNDNLIPSTYNNNNDSNNNNNNEKKVSARYTNFSQKSQNSLQNYHKILFFSFKLAFHFDWGLKGTWILIQTFSPRLGAFSGWALN